MSLRRFFGAAMACAIALMPVATGAAQTDQTDEVFDGRAALVAPLVANAGERRLMPLVDSCFAEYTGDNSTDFSSPDASALRSALADIAPGGTVKIAGTCAGAILESGTTQVALVTKAITLIGGYAPTDWTVSDPLTQPTILDAQSAGRVLFFSGVDGAVSNLVVQHGYDGGGFGGGIRASDALALVNVTFLDNTAMVGGGAYVWPLSTTMTGGRFQGNRALTFFGGGLFTAGLAMTDTQFISNTAQKSGGGVYVDMGPAVLTGGLFEDNRTLANDGGGLWTRQLVLAGTQFRSNTAQGSGGGARVYGEANLTGGVFQNNVALTCNGGGLFISHGLDPDIPCDSGISYVASLAVTGTQFIGNRAAHYGGGMYAMATTVVIKDGQFISNTGQLGAGGAQIYGIATVIDGGLYQNNRAATYSGGGLFAYSPVIMHDTRFVGNTAQWCCGGAAFPFGLVLNRGLFEGNQTAIYGGGGMQVGGTVALTGTRFARNSGVHGGGYSQFSGSGRLVNALFAGNVATSSVGAAMYFGGGAVDVLHTTIASPTLTGASAIFIAGGAVNLTDTLIANHLIGISQTGGMVHEDYSLFSGVTTPRAGVVGAGANSFTSTAAFANPALDNYHLSSISAAINAGIDAGVGMDFEGTPRPYGAGFDIGYDEWVPPRAYLPLLTR